MNVSPAARVNRDVRAISGSFSWTGTLSTLVSGAPPGGVSVTVIVCRPMASAATGMLRVCLPPAASVRLAGTEAPNSDSPSAVTSSAISPAGASAFTISSSRRLVSPGAMNRGTLAVTTTGSRTITSCDAWPTPVADHATAINLTVPSNAGRSNVIFAVPSGPTATGPLKYATSSSVGGGACCIMPPASPPERTVPRAPFMPSISRP